MGAVVEKRSEKKRKILNAALALLMESGDGGATMRKVADAAGMSLGNLQYHFRTRDDLLAEIVAMHFQKCLDDMDGLIAEIAHLTVRERARFIVLAGLRHGTELTDLCRIFRELWSISSRNERVRDQIRCYYAEFGERLACGVLGPGATAVDQARLASFIVPFIEGYSVTGPALPCSKEEVAEILLQGLSATLRLPAD